MHGFLRNLLWILVPISLVAQSRVVATGDIHGHCKQFEAAMQKVGILDRAGHWTGGDTVLVQTGDIIDKGPESRRCMEMVMRMELEAPKQRGRVIALLGNHEAVNLLGQLHAATWEDYPQFAGPGSAERQKKGFEEYLKWRAERAQRLKIPNPDLIKEKVKSWYNKHPLGFFEHRDAYGPTGQYGSWIRKHNALAQIGDEIFLHAGLDPNLEFRGVAELNMTIHQEITRFDQVWAKLAAQGIIWRYHKLPDASDAVAEELKIHPPRDPALLADMQWVLKHQDWMMLSLVGPLWFPGYTHHRKHQGEVAFELIPTLRRLHAKYVVMGHTPTEDGKIDRVLNNQVFRIDTGMHLDDSPGHPAALEFKDGVITAYYSDLPPEVLVKK